MEEAQKQETPGLATTSLVCGILGFFTCFLTGLPAIITGHLAQSKIKQSQGTLGGAGKALAGTILGYITTAASIIVLPLAALTTPAVFKALERAERTTNIVNAKEIHHGLFLYAIENSDQFPPDLDTLVTSGHLSDSSLLEYKTKKTATPWTYYPGLTTKDNDSILLAGPQLDHEKKRILLFVNGAAKTEDEADAQALAKKQGITLP